MEYKTLQIAENFREIYYMTATLLRLLYAATISMIICTENGVVIGMTNLSLDLFCKAL